VKIELFYFDGCPHHEAFASHLEDLLTANGIDSRPDHVLVATLEQAEFARFLGSPTLRIDGIDVEPGAADRTHYGMQCRLYRTTEGYRGAPPDEWILAALDRHGESVSSSG
jgi:hypothetical protein